MKRDDKRANCAFKWECGGGKSRDKVQNYVFDPRLRLIPELLIGRCAFYPRPFEDFQICSRSRFSNTSSSFLSTLRPSFSTRVSTRAYPKLSMAMQALYAGGSNALPSIDSLSRSLIFSFTACNISCIQRLLPMFFHHTSQPHTRAPTFLPPPSRSSPSTTSPVLATS